MRDLTTCVNPPAVSEEGYASLTTPTHRASTIVYPDAAAFAKRQQRGPDGYTYGLHGTPTTRTLEAQITALQGGARTLVVPSGQAAVSIVLLAVLKPGDKVLIPDNVYPPVLSFCADYLAPRGIAHALYDPMAGAGIADHIDAATKLVWIESPGSGTMEVQDVAAIARAAKAKGVLVGCDNTWATPLLFKPLEHGVDFVSEALTKYVGGHSDLLLGSITVGTLAHRDLVKGVTRALGIGVSPDECALALRGIQTMGVRLAHVGRVAEAFARRLADAAPVARVLHPALPTCPGHEFFKRDFKGASGLFSVVLKPGYEAALDKAMTDLKLFKIGASWGGTHSLAVPMAIDRKLGGAFGKGKGTILRFSIGLEDEQDLWADLSAMMATLAAGASPRAPA
jgi:cystathionine beta-lyase